MKVSPYLSWGPSVGTVNIMCLLLVAWSTFSCILSQRMSTPSPCVADTGIPSSVVSSSSCSLVDKSLSDLLSVSSSSSSSSELELSSEVVLLTVKSTDQVLSNL